MMYRYNADSWHEFIHDLRTRPINWSDDGSEGNHGRDWSGSDTWSEALDFAIKGHPAARAAIDSVTLKVTSAPEPLWDVAPVGAFPCIPAYSAGVPENMFVATDDAPPVSQPIVRIAVNMTASAWVDAEEIINRGAAIVTLIDRIQSSGRRVELIAFLHCREGRNQYAFSVTIKRPEEPVDMDRIGLAFATPIMLRRYFFRVMEFTAPRVVYGYGTPDDFEEERSAYHLTMPRIERDEYDTPEKATKTVMDLWEKAAIAA